VASGQNHHMKASYLSAATVAEVIDHLGRLRARTIVFDLEPLVAFWDTDHTVVAAGIADVLDQLQGMGLEQIVFATNSTRTPETVPIVGPTNVSYRPLPRSRSEPPNSDGCRDQASSLGTRWLLTVCWPGDWATRSSTTSLCW
jgi:hypothetical protein